MTEVESQAVLVSLLFLKPPSTECFIHSCFAAVCADFDLSDRTVAETIRDEVVRDLLAHGKPVEGWTVGHISLREVDADELDLILPAARRRVGVPE